MNDQKHASSRYSRRSFLKKAASAAAAVPFVSAAASSPDEPVVIGRGAFRYEVDHDWAELPAGRQFGYTHGIVEDSRGRIYIANQSPDAIMVFEPDGRFVTSWGADYEEGAHGLSITEEDGREVLYLANTGLAEVVKTTPSGEVIWRAGVPPRPDIYGEDKNYSPTETAIAPDGRVFVADGYGQSWIHIYTPEGEYTGSFGGPGEEPGNLNVPHGISIDDRGSEPVLQVADRSNVRIVNFDLDGRFMGEIIAPADLRYPCTTMHAGGALYVPDLFARLSIFDENNRKVLDLGDYVEGGELTSWDDFGATYPELEGYPNIPHARRLAGKFSSPHDLWVDGAGNIYVVEWIEDGRVTKLKKV